MRYRIQFDEIISNILSEAGYRTLDQKMKIWPAGLSASLIKQGKELGMQPETAAFLGLAKYIKDASDLSKQEKISIIKATEMIVFVKTLAYGKEFGVDEKIKEILNNLEK